MSKSVVIFTILALVVFVPCTEAQFIFDVTKTEDTADGVCNDDCSLREAVIAANDIITGGVIINVPAGTFTLSIVGSDDTASAGDLDILYGMEIVGAGADQTIVDGDALDRVFHVDPNAAGLSVQVSGLTITGGSASYGGGIYNRGFLTLSEVVISENQVSNDGGGVYASTNTLTIVDSTIRHNSAGKGGGVYVSGSSQLDVERSTISGNVCGTSGGGIYAGNSGSATLVNSTISENRAPTNGGGLYRISGTVTMTNCTMAGNTGSSNGSAIYAISSGDAILRNTLINGTCFGNITSEGGNLESPRATCNLGQPNDQPVVAQPLIGLLRDNGGATHTHALLPGSPALDSADNGFLPSTDQRGITRDDGFGDVGSYERRAAEPEPPAMPVISVTKTDDTDDGLCDADCSLREAIIASSTYPDTDIIDLPGGDYVLAIAGSGEDLAATGDLDIHSNLVIRGAGVAVTVIDADDLDGVFHVDPDGRSYVVELNNLAVTGGDAAYYGGGINNRGWLTLNNVRVFGNYASYDGGGISTSAYMPVNINDSTIESNTGRFGGGLNHTGAGGLSVNASSVSDNTASNSNGGGVYANGSGGASFVNSTLSGNTSGSTGGGLFALTGGVLVHHCTFSANMASTGDAINVSGSAVLTVRNTLIDGACFGDLGSEGGNLESPGDTCDLVQPDDQFNVADAMLGPLAANGGPTWTHALLEGSPAINTGSASHCLSSDQRGDPRDDGLCDIGSFEFFDEEIFTDGFEGGDTSAWSAVAH